MGDQECEVFVLLGRAEGVDSGGVPRTRVRKDWASELG